LSGGIVESGPRSDAVSIACPAFSAQSFQQWSGDHNLMTMTAAIASPRTFIELLAHSGSFSPRGARG
jgi:hypothetical protein